MVGIEGQFDIFGGGMGSYCVGFVVDWGDNVEVFIFGWGNLFVIDEIVVFGFEFDFGICGVGGCVDYIVF